MVAILSTLLALVAAPPPAADVQRAAKRVLDSTYQRSLPGEPARRTAGDGQRRRWVPPLRTRDARQRPRDEPKTTPSFMSTAATWLMYVLVAIVAVVLGVFIANEVARATGDMAAARDGPGHRDDPDTVPDVVARPVEDAEQLAARGEFGDAIRALLLRTLAELARQVTEPLPPSLTSREVLARVAITDATRGALTGLVTAVEISHFGNDVPTRGDYDECMTHFRSFARAYMRGDA